MKTIIIGSAGHVDHGKSYMLHALTGEETDRLPEEKKRGITITLGFQVMKTEKCTAYFVDVPGHESLVRNMIGGLRGLNTALFAVDVKEGVRSQTKEHAFIVKSAGIKNIIVAITKTDIADDSTIKNAIENANNFFTNYGFQRVTTLPFSIYKQETVENLKNVIINTAMTAPSYNRSAPFRMDIDRAFTINGAGTIITGSILAGEISEGSQLYIFPLDKIVRVRRIESAGECIKTAAAGMRVALNITGVKASDIEKGSAIYTQGAFQPEKRYEIKIINAPEITSPPKDNKIYNMFIGTAKIRGRLLLKSGLVIFSKPYPAVENDTVFIRNGSPETTVAAGIIFSSKEKEKIHHVELPEPPIEKASLDTEIIQKVLEDSNVPMPLSDIVRLCETPAKEIEIILKYLLNKEKIVTFEKAYLSAEVFNKYVTAVKGQIASKGFADIAAVREITGLSRNHCATLLDKGDRQMLWRSKDGKRY